MKRIAYYGGSFDPLHRGHLAIAENVSEQFRLDEFNFLPAFHAPHKPDLRPTSAFHRYAMLAMTTADDPRLRISRIELEQPERPYSVDTLGRLTISHPNDDLFFVIGADSWEDIKTWREWEKVLTTTNVIVVTRPGYDLETGHVTDAVRERIIDLRGSSTLPQVVTGLRIYFTDIVQMPVSATQIRESIRSGDISWIREVPAEVAKYIEKYQIYK